MKNTLNTKLIHTILLLYGVGIPASEAVFASSDRHRVLIHPFVESSQGFSLSTPNTYQSLQESPKAGHEAIDKVLRAYGVDQRVKAVQLSAPGIWLKKSIATSTFHFAVDNIPLCQFEVKTHLNAAGNTIIMGDIPAIEFHQDFDLNDWPDVNDALANAQTHALEKQSFLLTELKIAEKSACLFIQDGQAHAAWQLDLTQDGQLFYRAIADEAMVYEWQARYFHVTGKASIYNRNPLDVELTEFDLPDLFTTEQGGCYLENPYFTTTFPEGTQYLHAYASDCNFVFAEDTSQFQETSLFTNANRALQWLKDHGYQNFGDQAIRIVVHATFSRDGDSNNALYQPTSTTSTIYVGDGDGDLLQNLSVDGDVVSHELGHHVVFHSVTNISGESLVLHEALADYLTFARTGDPCLGSSICPDGGGVCAVPQQCLRTAINELKLGSINLPPEPHLRSQFLSGLLWDLRTIDEIPGDTLTTMVLKAIDLFVSNSGYQHLILGLMIVDDSDFAGQYCQKIYDRAIARGLGGHIETFTCDKIPGLTISNDSGGSTGNNTSGSSTGSDTQETSKKSKSWCGNVGFPSSGSWSLLILLLLPTLVLFRRQR
ncbi:MAG: GlyGly-CTERM sorting domain-containing protein [Oligoflexus sp.]